MRVRLLCYLTPLIYTHFREVRYSGFFLFRFHLKILPDENKDDLRLNLRLSWFWAPSSTFFSIIQALICQFFQNIFYLLIKAREFPEISCQ
jgi:hypothetical protein